MLHGASYNPISLAPVTVNTVSHRFILIIVCERFCVCVYVFMCLRVGVFVRLCVSNVNVFRFVALYCGCDGMRHVLLACILRYFLRRSW
jgi:hypothetical protein